MHYEFHSRASRYGRDPRHIYFHRDSGRRYERGGGRMRIFAHGDLRLVILHLIEGVPLRGYEIIKKLEALFFDNYSPSPGAVYPILSMLEALGFITPVQSDDDGSKKRFAITESGRDYLLAQKEVLDMTLTRINITAQALSGNEGDKLIMNAMQNIKKSLLLTRGTHNSEKAKEIAKVLHDAAQAIMKIAGREDIE